MTNTLGANMTCGMRTPDVCLQSRCCCGFPWTAPLCTVTKLCTRSLYSLHITILLPVYVSAKDFVSAVRLVGWLSSVNCAKCQPSEALSPLRTFPATEFLTPYLSHHLKRNISNTRNSECMMLRWIYQLNPEHRTIRNEEYSRDVGGSRTQPDEDFCQFMNLDFVYVPPIQRRAWGVTL